MKKDKTINLYSLIKNKSSFPATRLCSSLDTNNFARQFYGDDVNIYESFFMITLNRNNVTTGVVKIGQGGCTETSVDIKLISHYAIQSLAQGVICFHNHPSGNVTPSQQDIRITARIKECLKIFDINLLDHVIIAGDIYHSMTDNGEI